MTVPMEYKAASRDFDRFLFDARDALGHATTNQAYTTVQAVLTVFRRRLRPKQVALFARALPPVLRAIFIDEWDPDVPAAAFEDHLAMTREAQAYRGGHNFSPDDCITVVAAALRRHADKRLLDAALAQLPPGAAEFWKA
jgi:uncharacterized protein (DUF2267 family)